MPFACFRRIQSDLRESAVAGDVGSGLMEATEVVAALPVISWSGEEAAEDDATGIKWFVGGASMPLTRASSSAARV